MVTESFFAHVAPDGATLTDRLEANGYIEPDGDWTVGENIAWGQGNISTARSDHGRLDEQPRHRDNILTPSSTRSASAIVPGTPGDTSWGATYTTDFGAVVRDTRATPSRPRPRPPASRARPPRRRPAKRCKTGRVRVRAASVKRTAAARRATKAKRVATCAPPARRPPARAASAPRSMTPG